MTTTSSFPAAVRRAVPGGVPRGRGLVLRGLVLLAAASFFPTAVWAQGAEVSGFGGAATLNGGGGTHPVFGGSGGVQLADHLHIFFEVNHLHLLNVSTVDASGNPTTVGAGLTNFGGGVDYSFGSPGSKVRPYVLTSVGDGRIGASAEGVSAGVNSFYVGVGGGARVYLGKHWGIKPEVRVQHYVATVLGETGTYTGVYFTGGVFLELGQ